MIRMVALLILNLLWILTANCWQNKVHTNIYRPSLDKYSSRLKVLSPNNDNFDELLLQTLQRHEIWQSRRSISRVAYNLLQKSKTNRKLAMEINQTEDDKTKSSLSSSAVTTGIIFVAIALIARIGGRTALFQVLGLDILVDDSNGGMKSQISDLLAFFTGLENTQQILLFFTFWFFAKLLCVDVFSIALAISSGVLFNNLIEGTLVSVLCSSAASLIIFSFTRAFFRDKAQVDIQNRPVFKAIDNACRKNGFKTVFTLRLSSILPLPIGAYNYLYGLLSVSTWEFLAGITLGSVKPYLLDCYLGLFGRSILAPATDDIQRSAKLIPLLNVSLEDALSLLLVAVVILAGTFAAQVFDDTLKELQSALTIPTNNNNSKDDALSSNETRGMDLFEMFGVREQSVAPPILSVKNALDEAWNTCKTVIVDEWKAMKEMCTTQQVDNIPKGLLNSKGRTLFDFEKRKYGESNDANLKYLLESSIFLFVVLNLMMNPPNILNAE